jgi:hypothetical protein
MSAHFVFLWFSLNLRLFSDTYRVFFCVESAASPCSILYRLLCIFLLVVKIFVPKNDFLVD